MAYQPSAVPERAPAGLKAWLAQQFRLIAGEFAAPQSALVTIEPRGVEPARPTNGMLVYADGTAWNPGSGAGFYKREGGAWVKF